MTRKWIIGLLAGFAALLTLVWSVLGYAFRQDWLHLEPHEQVTGRIAILAAATVLSALLVLMAGIGVFVYRDARQRGMPPLLWTLVAVFVPYFVGLIAYLVVRQSRQIPCPACGARAPVEAAFCPHCGRPARQACPRCQGRLEHGARFCPHCGVALAGGASSPATA